MSRSAPRNLTRQVEAGRNREQTCSRPRCMMGSNFQGKDLDRSGSLGRMRAQGSVGNQPAAAQTHLRASPQWLLRQVDSSPSDNQWYTRTYRIPDRRRQWPGSLWFVGKECSVRVPDVLLRLGSLRRSICRSGSSHPYKRERKPGWEKESVLQFWGSRHVVALFPKKKKNQIGLRFSCPLSVGRLF